MSSSYEDLNYVNLHFRIQNRDCFKPLKATLKLQFMKTNSKYFCFYDRFELRFTYFCPKQTNAKILKNIGYDISSFTYTGFHNLTSPSLT